MKTIAYGSENTILNLLNGETVSISWSEPTKMVATLGYQAAYGMGERFDKLNHKGSTVVNQVEEKFCFQGEKTYCPTPFFCTDSGFGLYVDSDCVSRFDFGEGSIIATVPTDAKIICFTGEIERVLSEYMSLFGKAKLPPKWAFGIWASANRWNTQQLVEQQLDNMDSYNFPATVLVVEAWSDEATFYIWNGAAYTPKLAGAPLSYTDFDFGTSAQWHDPKGMVDRLHAAGIRLVLWQIPVYKLQGSDEQLNAQNELDRDDAVIRGLAVHNQDGSCYTIPQGNWFGGSMIPDFTNPDTVKTWFDKRSYLLEMGVDGFKTDGGEFIYSDLTSFADGTTGKEGKNRYSRDYTAAYSNFIGGSRVLFSRAGWSGQHTVPIHWAGDQQSQNCELRSQLTAGLTSAMSGIPFWSFDIGGFAGALPTLDLYRRATMMGCFCPVMQWHSEPDGGQFRELMAGHEGNNERSPWNMAAVYGAPEFIDEMRYWHWLRMNLLPYLYSEAVRCVAENKPMMQPMAYCYPPDTALSTLDDQYMLGDSLLVAPLLGENQITRTVQLPSGDWYTLLTGAKLSGGCSHTTIVQERFPVYLKCGSAVALNLPANGKLGNSVGKHAGRYQQLSFILVGSAGTYHFRDDLGNDFKIIWHNGIHSITGCCTVDFEVAWWQ